MSRASTPASHRAAIIKTIQRLAHRRSTWDVWRDWLEMAALAMRNAVDHDAGWQAREDRYLQIVRGYERDEVDSLCRCFADLVAAMEFETGDVLGSIYMELELGNKWTGQFFTPYDVCRMMARMNMADGGAQAAIARRGFVRVNEPAAGGGAMLIAMAEEMLALELNPQQQLHCVAVDVDIKAVHMCYLQLALLGIPAVIVHGNALSLEVWDQWRTPAHILGGWEWRLRRPEPADNGQEISPAPESMTPANDNIPADQQTALLKQVAVGETFCLF